MKIILIFLLLCFFTFAVHREYHDQPNCYLEAVPCDNDLEKSLFKKLNYCLIADTKTVKWRRSFIGAILFLILSCIFIHECQLPSYREIFLIVLIFYIIYYSLWVNYTETITNKVANIGKNIILRLKKNRKNA